MRTFRVSIAGRVVAINARYYHSYAMFRDFIVDEDSDFSIVATPHDLENASMDYSSDRNGLQCGKSLLESYALLRKASEALLNYNVFLMHGAVVAVDGKAYLFTGNSGVGKTTHVMKWLDELPSSFVVNGDKPFIAVPEDGSQPLACGSPWAGKEGMYSNAVVPLKAIVCLERSERNSIRELSFPDAFPVLLQQAYRPHSETKMAKTLALLCGLRESVSFYRFGVNNYADDAFATSFNAIY